MKILNVRHWTAPDHTRIVLDVDAEPVYEVEKKENLIVLNFPQAFINQEIPKEIILNKRGVKKLCFCRAENAVKIEFHLDNHSGTEVFKLKKFQGRPDRVVVDVLFPVPVVQEKEAVQSQPEIKRTRIIVIDPGHGGEDPGAVSRKKLYEKNIVLAISKEIKKEIDKIPGFRAVLTRTGDYYLSFSKRLKIARDLEASLFISVHADAAKNRKAKGSSVYSLSTGGASSEAARLLANNENLSDIIGGVPESEGKKEFDPIILNMFQTSTINLSRNYADILIKHLNKINCLKFESVQEAPFNVLKLPDIPAVLLETAYLSNPEEEILLKNPSFQKKLAKAVALSVSEYFIGRFPEYNKYINTVNWQKDEAIKTETINHTIRSGDTLSSIAKERETTLAVLLKLNNIELSDKIYVGQKILVPVTAASEVNNQQTDKYLIKKGDTLSSIAKERETTVAVLLKLNGIKLTDKVYAGQKILVPAENKKVSPSKTLRSYVVKKGDTLYSLAKSSSLTIDELCQLNNMKSSDTLYLGQKIKLPQ